MKRLLALLLVFMVTSCAAAFAAEYSWLDGLGQEQLSGLRDEIYDRLNAENPPWMDEKWLDGQPVTLEPGIYRIGREIPAGTWHIKTDEYYLNVGALDEEGNCSYEAEDFIFWGTFTDGMTIELLVDTYLYLTDPTIITREL